MKKLFNLFKIALLFLILGNVITYGQTTGDYRSNATGVDLFSTTNWQYYNGSAWVAATSAPYNAGSNNTITVQRGHIWNNQLGNPTINATLIHIGTTGSFSNIFYVNNTYIHNTASSSATVLNSLSWGAGANMIFRGSSITVPAVSLAGRTFQNLSFESTSGSWSTTFAGTNATSCLNFTLGNNVTVNETYTGMLTVNGNYTIYGTLNYSTGTQQITFAGHNNTIGGSGTIAFENAIFASDSLYTLNSNATVSGTLTMSSGNIYTGSNILILGTGVSALGTLSRTSGTIIGNFSRWFAASTVNDILFPMGSEYFPGYARFINISYTDSPSAGGTLTVSHTEANPGNNNNYNPVDDGGYSIDVYATTGFWTVTAGNGLTGGAYSIDVYAAGFLDGVNPNNYSKLHLIKRVDGSNNWNVDGTHSDGTLSGLTPVAHRTGLSGFSQFGIGSNITDNGFSGILPVVISSFISRVSERCVKLIWITTKEINNFGFEVFRRLLNNKDWLKVGFVKGNGCTHINSNYSFEDNKLNSGKYQYRLKQIDYNGNSSYFNLNGIVEVGIPSKYSLSQNYPNPFNPVTKIDYDLPLDSKVSILIYDVLGREVKSLVSGEIKQAGYHKVDLNASSLSSGVYFYRLIADGIANGKNFVNTKRMVIIK